jgi:hypothetical protein
MMSEPPQKQMSQMAEKFKLTPALSVLCAYPVNSGWPEMGLLNY